MSKNKSTAARQIEIIYKRLDEITPYENNPRKNDKSVTPTANSIKRFGFKVPVIIDKNGVIVCGHTRYKAAKKLCLNEIPCILADDLTPAQIKAFRLADNKTSEFAEWDLELLDMELADLKVLDFDMPEFGFEMPKPKNSEAEAEDGGDFEKMTFTLHAAQAEEIREVLTEIMGGGITETFGNTNRNGNALYEVVRQWQAQRT